MVIIVITVLIKTTYNNDDVECSYANRILISYAPVNELTSETAVVVKMY